MTPPSNETLSDVIPAQAEVETSRPPSSRKRLAGEFKTTGRRLGSRGVWPISLTLLAADFISLALAVGPVLAILFGLAGALRLELVVVAASWAGLLIVSLAAVGLYTRFPTQPVLELRGLSLATTFISLLVLVGMLLAGMVSIHGLVLVTVPCAAALVVLPLGRAAARACASRCGFWGRRVIVCGGTPEGATIYKWLERRKKWGLRPVGIVEEFDALDDSLEEAYLGPPEELGDIAREQGVDLAILGCGEWRSLEPKEFLYDHGAEIREWLIVPNLPSVPSLWNVTCEVSGRPGLHVEDRLLRRTSRLEKRAFDLAITLMICLFALPLIAMLALLVKLSSPGPVFYTQERIGLHGRRFRAWKFRSMLPNADVVLADYLAANPELRAEWEANHKLKDDPRITFIGNWLRKTSLDELPQIWNVLLGEMSLVGPRPIVAEEIEKYAADYEAYVRVTPGITGLWQISGRNNTTYPERVEFDAYYVRNWSPWLDLYILACTVKVVLLREGAY